MTPLLTKEAAREILGPHLADIAASMRDAIARHHRERESAGPVSPRTRACLINDYANENAERLLDGRPGVTLVRKDDETLIMIFDDRAIVRIKKLNADLRISYIPTAQAKAWVAQEPIDGFPEATYLIAGYTLDEFGQLDRLLLVCSKHNRRLWALDLDDDAGTGTLLDLAPEDQPQPGRAIVRSDRAAAEEADTNV